VSGIRTVVVVGTVVAVAAAAAVAASLLGASGDGSANGSVPVEGLDDLQGSWVAVNDTTTPAPLEETVRLVVDGATLRAETGCNSVHGTVAVEDSVLMAGPLASTRMACEPALMDQERWVTEMLSGHPRLELSGPYLALHWGERERWWLGLEREGGTPPSR